MLICLAFGELGIYGTSICITTLLGLLLMVVLFYLFRLCFLAYVAQRRFDIDISILLW
jgi:hypothetical protein